MTKLFFTLLLFVHLFILRVNAQDTLQVQVTNSKGQPLMDVIVLQQPHADLLGTTNRNGMLQIVLQDFSLENIVEFKHLGYQDYHISGSELMQSPKIVLQPRTVVLPEVTINAYSLPYIIKKTWKRNSLRYKGKKHYPRFYGLGHYAKAIEANHRFIHLRHEQGLFITSGNNKRTDKWDLAYQYSFIPNYSARSYHLTSDGMDTLKHTYLMESDIQYRNYNANIVHLFDIMRNIYLYAPFLSNPAFFQFQLIDTDSINYTIEFVSRTEYWPHKNQMFSKGTLKVNKDSFRLERIDFESMDILFFQLKNLKQYFESPHLIKASVCFQHDTNGHVYISHCKTETIWEKEPMKKQGILNALHPSRPFPARNHLIEREIWTCDTYQPIPEKYRSEATFVQGLYARSARSVYDSLYFKVNPNPLATPEKISTLEQYMPLEQQYRNNSNRYFGYSTDEMKVQKAKDILYHLFYTRK